VNLPDPPGNFSLSHLAIPIPMDDPLYGLKPDPKVRPECGFSLGAMTARGKRGTLIVDKEFLTRLPSNPFFPYQLERIVESISIGFQYGMLLHGSMLSFGLRSQFTLSPHRNELAQLPVDIPFITGSVCAATLRSRQESPLARKPIHEVRVVVQRRRNR
jgi:hypothetical protein